jgi:hypothetical protein
MFRGVSSDWRRYENDVDPQNWPIDQAQPLVLHGIDANSTAYDWGVLKGSKLCSWDVTNSTYILYS